MIKSNRAAVLGVVAIAACVAVAADPTARTWIASDGLVNAESSWQNNIPPLQGTDSASGEMAFFTGSSDMHVRIPATGWTDKGVYYLARNIANGTTLTFDATDTWWRFAPGRYYSTWQVFTLGAGASGASYPHILEVSLSGQTASRPVFKLTDGIVRLTPDSVNGSLLELARGEWNFLDSDGTATAQNTLKFFGNAKSACPDSVILRDGTSLKAGTVNLAPANVPEGHFIIEGGSHVLNAFTVGGSGASKPAVLDARGGRLACESLFVGGSANRATATFGGTSELTVTNLSAGTATGSQGELAFQGQSTFRADRVSVGGGGVANVTGVTGRLVMAGSATGVVAHDVRFGGNNTSDRFSGCDGTLELTDDADLTVGGFIVASAANKGSGDATRSHIRVSGHAKLHATATADSGATGGGFLFGSYQGDTEMELADDAFVETAARTTLGFGIAGYTSSLVIGGRAEFKNTNENGIVLGRGAGGRGRLMVRDEGRLTLTGTASGVQLSGNLSWGDYLGGEERFDVEGGSVESKGALVVDGTNAFVRLAGGTTSFPTWKIGGTARYRITDPSWSLPTNTVRVTGGVHTVRGYDASNVSIAVGSTNGNSRLEVVGGELRANALVRVGMGATKSPVGTVDAGVDHPATLLVSGGVLRIAQKDGSENGDSKLICSLNAGASSVFDFLGGEVIANCLRGGSGESTLNADGGTFTVLNNAGTPAIEKFTHAELGPSGLLMNVPGGVAGAIVRQAFTDMHGTAGLFVKTGAGSITVETESAHAKTVVNAGTLVAKAGTFGKDFTVSGGATLDLTADGTTTFSAERVTLGAEQGGRAVLKINPGDVVEATTSLALGRTALLLSDPSATGTFTFLRTPAAVPASALANLCVANALVNRAYSFAVQTTGDNGTVVTLTVAELEVEDNTWTGAEGSEWTGANFAASPTDRQRYTFPADAATFSVTVPAIGAYVRGLSVAGDYAFNGGAINLVGGVTATSGATSFANPIEFAGDITFNVATGASLSFSGGLSAVFSSASKVGGGELHLLCENSFFNGTWVLNGGLFDISSPRAFGVDNLAADAIVIKTDTLKYSGSSPGTLRRGVTVNTGSDQGRVVFDLEQDFTFAGGFNSVKGSFIKYGVGALGFDFDTGSFAMGTGNYNGGDGAINSVPDRYASPVNAAADRSAGLHILDGVMRVKGQGRANTTVNQTQSTWVGTGYAGQTAQTGLEIADVKYMQGGASRPLTIGKGVSANHPNAPYLSVTNSYLWANTISLGESSTAANTARMSVLDSEVELQWALNVGCTANDNSRAELRIGAGSRVRQYRDGGSSCGIIFNRNVDALVTDGATLEARSHGNGGYKGVSIANNAFGTVRVEQGARLFTDLFTDENTAATEGRHLDFVFDGGTLAFTQTAESKPTVFRKPECQGFVATGAGMEIAVGTGMTHTNGVPVRGDGAVVKTGAGTLALDPSGRSDLQPFQQAGALAVREGTLDLSGRSVAFGALGGGEGTIMNGRVDAFTRQAATAEEIEDVASTPRFGADVDFNERLLIGFAVPPELADRGACVAVARLEGEAPATDAWKSEGLADGLMAVYEVREGVVWATIKSSSGMTIILR